MIYQIVDCIKRLLLRNSDKPEPPKCPDFIPDKEEMSWVDPSQYQELHRQAVDAFDLAIEHPYALKNCKTFYEKCYSKKAATKEFNDWIQPEFDNPLF
tara:strand:- start:4752 stop:5045 length:294 start_codon:yes stop_codon:yes gene_type:complete